MTRGLLVLLNLTALVLALAATQPLSVPIASAQDQSIIMASSILDTSRLPGDTVNITVSVRDVGPLPIDLDRWEVNVTLDPSILKITRIIDGPILDDIADSLGGQAIFTQDLSPEVGWGSASEVLLLPSDLQPPDAGFTGSGVLFYLEATVLRNGTTNLNPTSTRLVDFEYGFFVRDLPHLAIGGYFSNVPCNQCNVPPVAAFTYEPSPPLAGTATKFNASSSFDPDNGTIVQYMWDFGDGSTVVESDPYTEHIYATAGLTMTVALTVRDNGAAGGSATHSFVVASPVRHDVAATLETPQNATPGDIVNIVVYVSNNGTFDENARLNLWIIGPLWDTIVPFDLEIPAGAIRNVTYSWNTTGRVPGGYDVTALALIELDDNPGNNGMSTRVLLLQSIEPDIIVEGVQPSKTSVARGETILITIALHNGGSTATFELVTRYEDNIIDSRTVTIQTFQSTSIEVAWNTAYAGPGYYDLWVEARPAAGEVNLSNNQFSAGLVRIADTTPLTFEVSTRSTYFPGETVIVGVRILHNGRVVDLDVGQISAVLAKDGVEIESLPPDRIAAGIYEIRYTLPLDVSAANYDVRITASFLEDDPPVDAYGTGQVSFAVRQRWLAGWTPWLAGLGAAAAVAILIVIWRIVFLKRRTARPRP